MALVEVSLAFGQRLMQNGASEPLIQIPNLHPDHSDTMFWILQAFGAIGVASIAAVSGSMAAWFAQPDLAPLMIAASFSLYFQAAGLVPKALLARRFEFSQSAWASVAGEIAGGLAGLAAALTGWGVWSLVAQRLLAAFTETVELWRLTGWRPRFRWSRRCFNDLWLFSSSRILEGLLLFSDQHIPRIILGKVAGPLELGYFVFARRIVETTVTLLNSPIRTTALSAFAAMQTDIARVRRTYVEGVDVTTCLVFPSSFGMAAIAPYLVPAIAGAEWTPAVILLQVLVIASIRQSYHVWNGAVLRGLGKPHLLLLASAVRTVGIIAGVFLLLHWGALGVCIGVLAGSYLSWPIAMKYVQRVTQLSPLAQLRPGLTPFVAATIMVAVLTALSDAVAVRLPLTATVAVLILVGILVYTACLALFGRSQLLALVRIGRNLVVRPGATKTAPGG
jgi:PST family polysaccharide transporter